MWVQFQLDDICEQTSDNAIVKTLKIMPEDLNATYERILDSIREKGRGKYKLARRVLICVAYSRSPIPVSLLRYAVSVEEDYESLEDLENSIPTDEVILDTCANLVSIDMNTSVPVVRFVHFSVQEFLTSHQSSIGAFGLEPELAHREIARMFILLLNILYSQPKDLGLKNLIEHWDMLHEWQYHLLTGNMSVLSVDDCMVTLVASFFEQSPPVPIGEEYLRRWMLNRGLPCPVYICFSPSALALVFGLPGVYQHYQPRPVLLNTPTWDRLKDIYIVHKNSFRGHLRHDPVIIFDDCFAVHYAIILLDSVPIVQRLYDYDYPIDFSYAGNSVNPRSNHGKMPYIYQRSPLCSARSEKMAKFLLDKGASTDPQYIFSDYELHDPLAWFARAGNTKLTELVSDRIVYHHARRHSATLLSLLADEMFNRIEVLSLLVIRGDVNARGGEYGTALQAAALGARIELVQLLLDKGADVNAQGGKHGTALQAAAYEDSIEVVQLLLGKGADVNALGGEYGTALQAAVYEADIEVVQLLLDKGADVNAQGGEYGTALQAAAYGASIEVVQLLLDKGADVNAQGGEYGTALQAAAYRGSLEIVLDQGADVNAQGGKVVTASQTATYWARIEVIQLLLDNGADVNAQGGEYGTALQAAVYRGGVEVVSTAASR